MLCSVGYTSFEQKQGEMENFKQISSKIRFSFWFTLYHGNQMVVKKTGMEGSIQEGSIGNLERIGDMVIRPASEERERCRQKYWVGMGEATCKEVGGYEK